MPKLPSQSNEQLNKLIKEMKSKRPPLAAVMEALAASNTTRDNPEIIARDIAMMLASRDAKSPLKHALDYYESTSIVNDKKETILRHLSGG